MAFNTQRKKRRRNLERWRRERMPTRVDFAGTAERRETSALSLSWRLTHSARRSWLLLMRSRKPCSRLSRPCLRSMHTLTTDQSSRSPLTNCTRASATMVLRWMGRAGGSRQRADGRRIEGKRCRQDRRRLDVARMAIASRHSNSADRQQVAAMMRRGASSACGSRPSCRRFAGMARTGATCNTHAARVIQVRECT